MKISRIFFSLILSVSISVPSFGADFGTVVDIGQYSMVVSPYVYKALGGKTKSNWQRMSCSNAASVALMVGTVQGLKHIVKSERPDMTDNRSFPSGHTAWAYLGAGIIDYEAGWRSPLYSIGAYSLASAIGAQRILSHRHHPVDVMAGAVIGIGASRAGYMLNDLIFKKSPPQFKEFVEDGKSLQFSISSSLLIPLNGISVPTYSGFSSSEMQTMADVDFAVNQKVKLGGGVGLRLRSIRGLAEESSPEVEKKILSRVAASFNNQLGKSLLLGCHADAGLAINVTDYDSHLNAKRVRPCGGVSAILDLATSDNSSMGLIVGYDMTSSEYSYHYGGVNIDVSKTVSSIKIGFRTSWRF